MKYIKLIWNAFFFLLITIAFFQMISAPVYAADPVEIGSNCADENAIYHLTSNIEKTPWQLSALYAVPVGTISPDFWEMSSYFNEQFITQLQSGQSAQAYAEACAAVWQNFFSNDADLIVRTSRTITSTDQIVQCISGNWVLSSTGYLSFEDASDWLNVNGSPFDVTDESSATTLATNLQSLLDNLNAQPGAASEP